MSIEISEQRGVRYLHFGSPWIQGAMRIARPWALELEYTRDLMAPLLLRSGAGWPRSVLQVGLGSASITRFLHRHYPQTRLTIVEILPEVVHAARLHFKLPEESPHLRIVLADGADYVATKEHRFDMIVVDAYDARARPGMLDSEPFYLNCRQRLAEGGMLSVNLLTRSRGIGPSVARIRRAFDGRVLVLPPSEAGNTVVVATRGDPAEETYESLRAGAARIKAASGLDLGPMVARIAQVQGGAGIGL